MLLDERLVRMIVTHEGIRLKPYRDSVGKLTIGVGRNLDDMGITEGEALYLLRNDIRRVVDELYNALPFWEELSMPRRAVLIDMCFNLGLTRFLGFKRMLACLGRGDYDGAAREMLDSRWAGQVGRRADDLATMMRENRYVTGH